MTEMLVVIFSIDRWIECSKESFSFVSMFRLPVFCVGFVSVCLHFIVYRLGLSFLMLIFLVYEICTSRHVGILTHIFSTLCFHICDICLNFLPYIQI